MVDEAAEAATMADSPAARGRDTATRSTVGRASSEPTPTVAEGRNTERDHGRTDRPRSAGNASLVETTLRDEEAARASEFGRIIACFALVGVFITPVLSEVLWLRVAAPISLMALAMVGAWVWRRARKPGGYTRPVFRTFAITAAVTAILMILYGGVYSSAPILVMLGITVFGMSDDRVFTIAMGLISTAAYVALALLELAGVIPDQGMFVASVTSGASRAFLVSIVPVMFLVAQWNARASRRATYTAVVNLDNALKLVHQREAQLDEARQQVEAEKARGIGRGGRYTDAVVGNYRLGEVIGRGGMGDVYAATHVAGGTRAAVKVLQRDARDNAELVERFRREAQITATLAVPNVVSVYEVGEAPGGEPYIAMELLEGHDLAWHLRQRPQLSIDELERLMADVATGLTAAHGSGIVHRDIKPENLFLAESTSGTSLWKILDFGVSKLRDSTGTLTKQHVIGTPGYMSPEQAQGRDANERSDVFSAGTVLYRALTGRPAFQGSDPLHVLFELVYNAPVRPSALRTDVHSDVEHFLAIAMAKRPEDRFVSARELAVRFREGLHGELPPEVRAHGRRLADAHPWKEE